MRTPWIIGVVLSAGITLDLLSIIAWSTPSWLGLITAVVIVVVAVLALSDIRLGVAAVFLELLWGSHGYLFAIPWGGINLSLRMGIFLAVFAATVWHLRTRHARSILWNALSSHPARWPALAFLITLAYGLVIGLARYPFTQVFFDANAWGFLALAPAFILATLPAGRPTNTYDAPQKMPNAVTVGSFTILTFIIFTGALYLILRTYLLLFIYSHDLGGFWLAAYQWVRDTRLGEVTIFPGAFPRVFLPSMALLFPALLLAGSRMMRMSQVDRGGRIKYFSPSLKGGAGGGSRADAQEERLVLRSPDGEVGEGVGGQALTAIVFGGSVAVLLLSLSRSYWLGLLSLCGVWLVWSMWRSRVGKKHSNILENVGMFMWRVWRTAGAAIVMFLLAIAVVYLPYPKPLTTAGIGSTLLARFSADAAVSNRWQQIEPLWEAIRTHPVFGSGFGTAVTYETKDPRTLAAYPDGKYTTTAFEWGYLDDLLERGFLGLLVELWLIGILIRHGIRTPRISPPPSEGERPVPRSLEGEVGEGMRAPMPIGGGSTWGRGSEATALALGLFAIAVVHATSPYLNHPLGIGLLLCLFAMETPRSLEEERGAVVTR